MNEPKLIAPDGSILNIPYYEVGLFCEELCKNYIEKSEENKLKFEQFAQNYTCFKPYYDFVIFKLGYKVVNPFFREDSLGYSVGNFFIVKELNKNTRLRKYLGVSDENLKITNYEDVSLKEGFIDRTGTGFKVDRIVELGHVSLCEKILNQYLIYSKAVYDDYIRSITDSEISKSITIMEYYIVERLNFTHMCIYDNGVGNIIFNDKYKKEWFDEFKNLFEKEYEYISFLPLSEQIDLDIEPLNMEDVGVKNESRTI